MKTELKFDYFRIKFQAQLHETLEYLEVKYIKHDRFLLNLSAHSFNEKVNLVYVAAL